MKKVKFALIGAGKMAQQAHYPALSKLDEVELVGICDLFQDKAKEVAEQFNIPNVYTDYRKMLKEQKVDGVYILMPPHHLFDIVMYALSQNLHVFIEKPPGITTYQAQAMARQAEKYNCISMVGLNRQHAPVLRYGKDFVTSRGVVTQVVATFFKQKGAAFFNGALSALHSDTIHCVDAMRYLADADHTEVHSLVSQFGDEVVNSWNSIIRFQNGAVGVLMSHYNPGTRIHRFEIHGKGVSALLDPSNGGMLYENGKLVEEFTPEDIAADEDKNGFLYQAKEFVAGIQEGRQPRTNFADAARTMELCDLINAGSR